MKITEGCKVKVDYTGTLDDGKVFDSSEGKEPLAFVAGAKQIIKGFDEAVMGMEEGEEKEIKLAPEQAYGERKEELVQTVPKTAFGEKLDPKEGQQLMLKAPTGQQMMAVVKKVEGENVTLDMNHPLVGKTLTFKFKVVSVEEGSVEEAAHDCSSCGTVCGSDCSTEGEKAEEVLATESPEEVAEEAPEDKPEEAPAEEVAEEKSEEVAEEAPEEKTEEAVSEDKTEDAPEEKSEEKPDDEEVKDALGGV